MSCRTTFAGSAFTSYARLQSGAHMSDVATLSAFHRLRSSAQEAMERSGYWREVQNDPGRLEVSYRAHLEEMRERVEGDQSLSEARRASLLERLAAAENQVPDASTIYALSQIQNTVTAEAAQREAFLRDYAATTEGTYEDAVARFAELEDGIERGRSAGAPITYTEENRSRVASLGLGRERGTVHAHVLMSEEMDQVRAARAQVTPRRVSMSPVTVIDEPTSDGRRVVSYGFDPRSGHLELLVAHPDGTQSVTVMRNVGEHEVRAFTDSTARSNYYTRTPNRFLEHVERYDNYRYRNTREEEEACLAPRCTVCGQFSAVGHACPTSITAGVTEFSVWRTANSNQRIDSTFTLADGTQRTVTESILLPQVLPLRRAVADGSVIISNINTYINGPGEDGTGGRWDRGHVVGEAGVLRDLDGNVTINTSSLRCDCEVYQRNYHCRHIDRVRDALNLRMFPPTRSRASMTPEQREQRDAEIAAQLEAAAALDWTRDQNAMAEAQANLLDDAEVSYAKSGEAFLADYNTAQAAAAAEGKTHAIPYTPGQTVSESLTRDPAGNPVYVGVEIEFDGGDVRAIGQELFDAGITASPDRGGYHGAQNTGWAKTAFERDGSVTGGEIVTRKLDLAKAEDVEELEKIFTILNRHGAEATTRAGAHVSVSTGFYQGDPAKYLELARLAAVHEDDLYRLTQEPSRGKHRQSHYVTPNGDTPVEGFADIRELRRWQSYRTRALNFNNVAVHSPDSPADAAQQAKDRVEFRLPDANLDPAVTMTQLKMFLGMVQAAPRIAAGTPTRRVRTPVGTHADIARARGRRRMTEEDILADSASVRVLADTIFSTKADKAQIAALFAATKWNKASRGNQSGVATDRHLRARRDALAAEATSDGDATGTAA